MKLFQSVYAEHTWSEPLPEQSGAQLVLLFGDREQMANLAIREAVHAAFPHAQLIGCTTSGEIQGASLHDDSLCLTAVEFAAVSVQAFSTSVSGHDNVLAMGQFLARSLPAQGLRHVLVLSDGQLVNGSELINGLTSVLPDDVVVTGGLAGDGARFEQTVVWHNDLMAPGLVVAVGLYGDALQVGHGHLGGWKAFGPLREITRSDDNVLYEIDGRPALELYKTFLGEHAKNLPASALLFPLAMTTGDQDDAVIRTILSIDEAQQSMTFAGNMPTGATCQLMRANYDNLVDGAQGAARHALTSNEEMTPQLALLISCVGRRLALNQRVEEELEIVQETLPLGCAMTGFYSYGEVSPIVPSGRCGLHNQTMTITLLSEKSA